MLSYLISINYGYMSTFKNGANKECKTILPYLQSMAAPHCSEGVQVWFLKVKETNIYIYIYKCCRGVEHPQIKF